MKRFYILGLLILCTVMTVHAATYCAETITSTNDKHTAKITCSSLGGNKYQFVFVSTDAFTSYNAAGSNFHMYVNGEEQYHVSEHMTPDGNTLTAVIESNTVPTIYANAFFVNYSDGEAQFDIPTDADFSQTCSTSEGGGTEPPFDPNTNLALGKPVVAGASESESLQPSNITDGNINSRWSSGSVEKDKDWVYIDLGNSYRLSEVDIYFEYAYSTNFVIQGAIELPDPVSDDSKWETLCSFTGTPNYTKKNEGGEEAKNAYMVSGVARYVRIRSYEKSLNNISIWEVRVYGKLVTNVALHKPVVAGHYDSKNELLPSHITDGNLSTRWSGDGAPQDHSQDWVYIDLGDSYRLSEVDIFFEEAYSKEFVIQGAFELPDPVSDDSKWETLYSFKGEPKHTGVKGSEAAKNAYMVSSVARYVRIRSYDNSLDNKASMSIYEVRVYGTVVTNVALGKPVVAGFGSNPSYITDGNLKTRWEAMGQQDNYSHDWVYIDLGASYRLSEVDIYFEYAYSTNFVIQGAIELPDPVSDDSKWETLCSFTGTPNYTKKNEGGEEAKNAYMVSGVARYVRIRSYQNWMNNVLSIWEVRVYGKLVCTYSGGAGDGQTATGYSVFTTGYKLSLELHETEDSVVVVKAEYLDKDKMAEHAYMHNYGKDLAVINQIVLDREGDTQVFSQEIPFSSFKEADGVICFGVKFEIPESMRVTTPEYFYLDGLGCAERVFTIYHGVDLPDDAEKGAVTEYKGGRILQPIRYKRKLRPATWETLCLPFTVDSITVYDPKDKQNYKLYAQYRNGQNVIPGDFWLRKFVDSEVTAGAAFQNNWQDIEANSQGEALPKMGVPYIIRVPGGDYYNDKYIVFHGAGYQTIDETYTVPVLPEKDGYFSYSGNNTMMPWKLENAYVLDAVGEYFYADKPVTLRPFECAVNATKKTIQRSPRLMMSSPQIPTDHGLPSTEYEGGRIYTTMGVLVGTFDSLDEQENCLMHLPEGIYIVQRAQAISKIHISK